MNKCAIHLLKNKDPIYSPFPSLPLPLKRMKRTAAPTAASCWALGSWLNLFSSWFWSTSCFNVLEDGEGGIGESRVVDVLCR